MARAEGLTGLPSQGGEVLVHDTDGQRAAALLALLAFSDKGMSASDARGVGASYGLARLAPAVEAALGGPAPAARHE